MSSCRHSVSVVGVINERVFNESTYFKNVKISVIILILTHWCKVRNFDAIFEDKVILPLNISGVSKEHGTLFQKLQSKP